MSVIFRKSFGLRAVTKEFPPQVKHKNKRAVFEEAGGAENVPEGEVVVSRWGAAALPLEIPQRGVRQNVRQDFFDYGVSAAGEADWYLNFAHHDAFAFYGGPLLAQDELQVAEHPVLASVREALLAEKINPFTTEDGKGTPILVQGVPRQVAIATGPNAMEGRPSGLYGNAFARASEEVVRRACRRIAPATISNIVAMEAPAFGTGVYTATQVRTILMTAHTGFSAARAESLEMPGVSAVNIHTGFWGCGAYGGNRVLMTMLQLLAARLAGIDGVVFHAGDKYGVPDYQAGEGLLTALAGVCGTVEELILAVERQGHRWGVSDGN